MFGVDQIVLGDLHAQRPKKGFFYQLTHHDDPFEEERFPKEEIKRIRQIIREQLRPNELFINLDGIILPRIGHIFRMKEGTRYEITRPGSLIFIKEVLIGKRWLADPEQIEVQAIVLDREGRQSNDTALGVRINDIEPVENEKEIMAKWNKPAIKMEPLRDGEAVELAEDVIISEQASLNSAAKSITFQKGLKGVVDRPTYSQGASLDEINSPYERQKVIKHKGEFILISGTKEYYFEEALFTIPSAKAGEKYKVYLPDYRGYHEFARGQLKKHIFDKKALDKVIMDEKTRKTILSFLLGKEEDLSKWGVGAAFKKGKGKTCAAFGPPGTGKTMSAEAAAEILEIPLYYADSADFGYTPAELERGLNRVIEQTNKWGSLTIIDDSEFILQSRDTGSSNAVAVLRNLEKLERGILWFTSNRPFVIDPAIESRIRAQFWFPRFTSKIRREVWKLSLPKDMPIAGLDDKLFDELVKIPINGREIKNVILNAADQASSEGKDHVPAAYLFEWAKVIPKNHEVLRTARDNGDKSRPIGFTLEEEE